MENLDLNIQNYTIEDILRLFHIKTTLTEEELKKSYRMYLKTHPDKSGLDAEVFRFFKKAYDILEKIYYFRNKRRENTKIYEPDEIEELSKDKLNILNKLNGLSCKEFNKKFNEMFEIAKINDTEDDTGYGEWYRNYKDKNEKRVGLSEFGREFEKRKKESKALVVKNELRDMGADSGYSLDRSNKIEYSSNIFSGLQYEDLKKAHTETVVPVTMEDFNNKEQFNSLQKYKEHRDSQNVSPISLQQSKNYLNNRDASNEIEETGRIFNIIKRDEEISQANNKMWGYLQRLK